MTPITLITPGVSGVTGDTRARASSTQRASRVATWPGRTDEAGTPLPPLMRGLSGSELARRAGYHPSLVSKVEHGRVEPWPAFRERVAAALGVDQELVFGGAPAEVRSGRCQASPRAGGLCRRPAGIGGLCRIHAIARSA